MNGNFKTVIDGEPVTSEDVIDSYDSEMPVYDVESPKVWSFREAGGRTWMIYETMAFDDHPVVYNLRHGRAHKFRDKKMAFESFLKAKDFVDLLLFIRGARQMSKWERET